MDIIAQSTLLICFFGMFMTRSNNISNKKFLILTSVILTLISGLRNVNWGPQDNLSYSIYYSQVCSMRIPEIIASFPKDTGYHIFTKLISFIIGDNYTMYLVMASAIFIGSVSRLIYTQSKDSFLSVVLLLALGIFDFSMMGVRQSLALAMVALSYEWLVKRKIKYFVVFVILASFFHQTALLFLIVYPLSLLKFKRSTLFVYIGILISLLVLGRESLGYFNFIFSMSERYAGYADRDVTLSYAGLIQLLLFLGLSMPFYKKAVEENKNFQLLMHLLLLAILFQSMASQLAEFFRIALYFKLFLIIMIPNILQYSKDRKMITNVLICLLLYYYLVMGAVKHDYAFFWELYIPKY